ncbi:MAG: prolyl-tRNA synthetase associated domain-containing protein [Bacteroidetes bacterium]|nr:prolyl-tRNA synthetase associated domain-containing protein [Bacteroidota bacterium]
MNGDPKLYKQLNELNIKFEYHEHPAAPTVEIASQYWKDLDATHCKNLFFRNHKGNKHYLVIIEHRQVLDIRNLELKLKQGKLSFASPERMKKYLGVYPGSVTPLGLINDIDSHVHLFLDDNLKNSDRISFHPNENTASLVINYSDFIKFLDARGNKYEYVKLYD